MTSLGWDENVMCHAIAKLFNDGEDKAIVSDEDGLVWLWGHQYDDSADHSTTRKLVLKIDNIDRDVADHIMTLIDDQDWVYNAKFMVRDDVLLVVYIDDFYGTNLKSGMTVVDNFPSGTFGEFIPYNTGNPTDKSCPCVCWIGMSSESDTVCVPFL